MGLAGEETKGGFWQGFPKENTSELSLCPRVAERWGKPQVIRGGRMGRWKDGRAGKYFFCL